MLGRPADAPCGSRVRLSGTVSSSIKGRCTRRTPAGEMRGRAAEIADAGALDWEVVWEALKTEPPGREPVDHHSGARARRRGRDHSDQRRRAGDRIRWHSPWAACGG